MKPMTGSNQSRWFANLPPGKPFDAGRQSLDYSFQLAVGLNNFKHSQAIANAASAAKTLLLEDARA